SESETTSEFSVVLDAMPIRDVYLVMDTNDDSEARLSVSALTFSPDNWNQAQTVTVTGVADLAADGDTAFDVSFAIATDSDPGFLNVDPVTVSGTNQHVEYNDVIVQLDGQVLNAMDRTTGRTLHLESTDAIDGLIDLSGNPVDLEIRDLGSFDGVIEIRHQADDSIQYESQWMTQAPSLRAGQLLHHATRAQARLQILNDTPFRNPFNVFDVNQDGLVTAIDALDGINRLSVIARNDLSNLLELPSEEDIAQGRFRYFDVVADGRISAVDSLNVITELGRLARSGESLHPGYLAGEPLGNQSTDAIMADWAGDLNWLF
ncbi:MAG: dockerin type I domain-containing protein, partial [Planctomycetota bacterium]